ncbi:hypothetical protein [Campylobacter sputorum]
MFKAPFVCGARNLGEALRRVSESAKMIRTKGEAGTGGVATPADAALMRQLGAEGVFVGSGIFKSGNPAKMANAIVKAVANYNNIDVILEVSKDLGEIMVGINEEEIKTIMSLR